MLKAPKRPYRPFYLNSLKLSAEEIGTFTDAATLTDHLWVNYATIYNHIDNIGDLGEVAKLIDHGNIMLLEGVEDIIGYIEGEMEKGTTK